MCNFLILVFMTSIIEKALLNIPINFHNKCYIHIPLVKEVVGMDKFHYYLNLLTITQEEIEDMFVQEDIKGNIPTPWEYLILNSNANISFQQDVVAALSFFTNSPITILDNFGILIGDLNYFLKNNIAIDLMPIITAEDFFEFQNCIREVSGLEKVSQPNPDEDPRIKRMKAKARYRDKIKAKQNQKKGIGLKQLIAAISCMDTGLNPLNIGEISYVAFRELIAMYQNKEAYANELNAIYNGAGKKVHAKYWITRDTE